MIYKFILLISSLFSVVQCGCSNTLQKDYKHLLTNEFNKLSQVNFLDCEYNNNKTLSISYIDSVQFSSLHIETELRYFLLKDIIDTIQIDSVRFNVIYPNRPEFPSRVNTVSTNALIKNIEPRYIQNLKYLKLSENLFYEYNGRESTILILSYWYGYCLENQPKEDEVYDENIFQLLYACTLEIDRGEYGMALIMLDEIHKKITQIRKNSDFYSKRVVELKKFLKMKSSIGTNK